MKELSPPFHLEVQKQTEWCWAAVAASVKNWGIRGGSPTIRQCDVVEMVRPQPGLSACREPRKFNHPDYLHLALEALEIDNGVSAGSCASFDTIRDEIDRNRPICARVVWDPDGDGFATAAHVVVIAGYEVSGPTGDIKVFDPAADPAGPEPRIFQWAYEEFKTRYREVGVWKDTYFVKV